MPADEVINAIDLKKGRNVLLCGPPDKQFGSVEFETSCSEKVKKDFNLAIALLHSFEYDEAEKVFAKIINEEPACAMAYWGVAMSNYHPDWAPAHPTRTRKRGQIIPSHSLRQKSKRESDYIEAIALFYKDRDTVDHHTRASALKKQWKKLILNIRAIKRQLSFMLWHLMQQQILLIRRTLINEKPAPF